VAAKAVPALDVLASGDLEALGLASQVLAHKAALADMPRVEMFFMSVEAEVAAEAAARGQRGKPGQHGDPGLHGGTGEGSADPWRTAPLTPTDRAAIRAYLELLRDNERLSPAVREYVRGLVSAGRVS
jgi:hypothetical protein